jgi:hypothetical protein
MNYDEFQKSLHASSPPEDLSGYLQSLWYDAKGDWNRSHDIIQNIEDKTAAWVHAYLHRKEGDIGNADYWYRRAGRTRPNKTLEEEWKNIAEALL